MVFRGIAGACVIFLQQCYLLDGAVPADSLLDNNNSDQHRHSFNLLGVLGDLLLRAAGVQLHFLFGVQGWAPGEGEQFDEAFRGSIFRVERVEAVMFFSSDGDKV